MTEFIKQHSFGFVVLFGLFLLLSGPASDSGPAVDPSDCARRPGGVEAAGAGEAAKR